MASWDDEGFEPAAATVIKSAWDDEEDEDVKDSWDASDDDEKDANPLPTVVPKKKISLAQKIKEREEKAQAAKDLAAKKMEEEEEDPVALRIRMEKLQREADLKNAMDLFNIQDESATVPAATRTEPTPETQLSPQQHAQQPPPQIQPVKEKLVPKSKDDFEQLAKEIFEESLKCHTASPHFFTVVDSLARQMASSLKVDDIRKLTTSLNIILNDKVKASKGPVKKKPAKKASLRTEFDVIKSSQAAAADDDDYDDFM